MTGEQIELLEGVVEGSHWFVTGEVRIALKRLLDELDRLTLAEGDLQRALKEKSAAVTRWRQAAEDNEKTARTRTEELRSANEGAADLEQNVGLLQTALSLAEADVERARAELDRLGRIEEAYAALERAHVEATLELRATRNDLFHANFLLVSIDHLLHGGPRVDRHNPD